MQNTAVPKSTWSLRSVFPSLKVMGMALWCLFTGCGEGARSPLVITDPSVNVGVFDYALNDGKSVEHTFRLLVWSRSPVVIGDIQVDCGCMAVDKQLIGMELLPGSVHALRLRVNPQGKAGVFKAHALLKTEPSSREPLVLALQVFIAPRPVVSPERLLIEAEVGADVRGELNVSRLRDVGAAPMVLDRTRCDFGTFLVTERPAMSEMRNGGGVEALVDRLKLEVWSSKRLPTGEHQSQLKLAWQGGMEPSIVPIVVRVVHPMRAQVDRLFCGVVKPGERKRIELGVTARGAVWNPVERTECDLDFVASQVNESRNGVVLEIEAPTEAGRFSGTIKIMFAGNGGMAPLLVPISVMVVE